MKQLLLLPALLLMLSTFGCGEATTENVKKEAAGSSETSESGAKPAKNSAALVMEVDKTGLESTIAENNVTLIDFTATWCGPCQAMKPWLKKTAAEYEGKVKFVAVDVDKSGDVAKEYKIEAMPTLVVLKDGKEVGRVVGAQQGKIKEMIDGAL